MTGPAVDPRPGAAARLLILLVAGYRRVVSPLLAPRCRFSPSCSAYAAQAWARHGALRGSRLVLWRLVRCQPFCRGGHDPVPPARPVPRTEKQGTMTSVGPRRDNGPATDRLGATL